MKSWTCIATVKKEGRGSVKGWTCLLLQFFSFFSLIYEFDKEVKELFDFSLWYITRLRRLIHDFVCFSDLPNAHGLAVDWVSRNLFWTSYDANKRQINVARLDGSFKNAVIQGLDKPHCLVLHPILGWVICTHTPAYTDTHKHTHTHTGLLSHPY